MILLAVLLLGIIGFTADAAFSMGVMGAAMNLTHAQPKPEAGLYITGDIFFVIILFISIIYRVRYLVRTAANPVLIRRR